MGYEGSHSVLWFCLYLILQRASSSQASNLTMPDFVEVLSKGQMWVDERMENRRIINKILPCTLCPCKLGSGFQAWLQPTVALWRRVLYAPVLYLGNIFPRFGSLSSYLPLHDVIDQLFFMLCTSHKLQASCTTPICVGFLLGFFFFFTYCDRQSLYHFSFLPTTHFQFFRGFHVTPPPP